MWRWAAVLLLAAAPVSAAEKVEVGLEVAGHSDLGGAGPFDDVAVVGRTAIVATGDCPGGTLTVVDLKDPRRPSVVTAVPLPAGMVAGDVDARTVVSESFAGDLVAVALSPCGPGVPGVAYLDITVPAGPRLLAQRPAAGSTSVSIADREDGRVLAVHPVGPDAVSVEDISDPTLPATAGRWSATTPPPAWACGRSELHVAALSEGGVGALLVSTDGRVHELDLSDPSRPFERGETARPSRNRFGAVMPVGTRTLGIVADEGPDGACPDGARPGLRVLELHRDGSPLEVRPVEFTTAAAPGRLVASGELAYVAWHGDGLRVVDMGAVKPTVTAQFIPEQAAVVAVALLDEHVLVVDRNAGLYVLERPDEGGPSSTWWTNVVGLLPYLLFAALLTALLVLPRLALGKVRARSRVPSPVPEALRRRVS